MHGRCPQGKGPRFALGSGICAHRAGALEARETSRGPRNGAAVPIVGPSAHSFQCEAGRCKLQQPTEDEREGQRRRLGLAGGQFLAVLGVGWWDVDVDCPQCALAGVADLMSVAGLDEKQGSGVQRLHYLVDDRGARSFSDKQPLIGASVPVARSAFAVAGGKHHDGTLGLVVAQADPKPSAYGSRRLGVLGRRQLRVPSNSG